jgi:hypothetical protein
MSSWPWQMLKRMVWAKRLACSGLGVVSLVGQLNNSRPFQNRTDKLPLNLVFK